MASKEKLKIVKERQEQELRTRLAEKEAVRQEVLATQGPAALEDHDREEERKAKEAESKAKKEATDEATRIAAEKKAEHARIAKSGKKVPTEAAESSGTGKKRNKQ